jgi:phi LC3 family holin
MINWQVRFRNKNFWISAIPAALLLVQAVLACFGVTWDYSEISQELLGVVNALFAFLAILGVVTDPTTQGIGDSALAMTYSKPKETEGAVSTKGEAPMPESKE